MPATTVYRVKLASMAAMAASLMWRGVAKGASPAPKSISWAPWARSLAASAVTAMVAETSMRPIRSAKILVAIGIPTILADSCPFAEASRARKLLLEYPFRSQQVLLGVDSDGGEGCGLHIDADSVF